MGYLGVVVSALLGAIALHEWPTTSAIVGMGLMIAGGLAIVMRPQGPGCEVREEDRPLEGEPASPKPEV
jgi:drug/metabolite transporter (DMT)-like permease